MRSPVFLIVALLIVVVVAAFNPSVVRMFRPDPPSAASNTRADLKVWVNKRSGFYYCPSSRAYGTLNPGGFMNQGDALQTGFRPAPHMPCI